MTVGAAIIDTKTAVTLEANGAQITNNSIVQANDANYSVLTDGGGYPHGRFAISWTSGATPTEGSTLVVVAQPRNVVVSNNAEAPETTRYRPVGSFVVNNVATAQYDECYCENLPFDAAYYVYNNNTGTAVAAGWTLTLTPYSYAPAAS